MFAPLRLPSLLLFALPVHLSALSLLDQPASRSPFCVALILISLFTLTSNRVDFEVDIDWDEDRVALKVSELPWRSFWDEDRVALKVESPLAAFPLVCIYLSCMP